MIITPYSKNAKKHPAKQIEQIKASLKEFGVQQPIVVDKDGVIIVGHGRYQAIQELGWEMKPEWVKVADLTEDQAKAYRLADNKLNESEWDMDLVMEDLKDLEDDLVELTGFDKDLLIEPDEADDEVPEVPEEPQSKLGDLYELGNHRVLCGDSTDKANLELLMDGNKADIAYTDPPYGMSLDVDYDSMFKNDKNHKTKGNRFDSVIDDDKYFDPTVILGILADIQEVFLWGADYFYDSLPRGGSLSAWDKRTENLDKVVGNTTEFLWSKQPHRRMTARVLWSGHHGMGSADEKSRVHPTQKPIKLHEWFFENYGNKSKTVLDLFLGSGSTLIACEQTDRTCYGMELDPKYVDVIVQRYVDYTGNATIKKNGEEIVWKKTPTKSPTNA